MRSQNSWSFNCQILFLSISGICFILQVLLRRLQTRKYPLVLLGKCCHSQYIIHNKTQKLQSSTSTAAPAGHSTNRDFNVIAKSFNATPSTSHQWHLGHAQGRGTTNGRHQGVVQSETFTFPGPAIRARSQWKWPKWNDFLIYERGA